VLKKVASPTAVGIEKRPIKFDYTLVLCGIKPWVCELNVLFSKAIIESFKDKVRHLSKIEHFSLACILGKLRHGKNLFITS